MIRKFTYSVFFLLSFSYISAQQDPYYSHFMYNKLAYNPGAAGQKDAICASVLGHKQWLGLGDQSLDYKADGSTLKHVGVGPTTLFATITAPVKLLRGGVGLVLMNDKLGYEQTIQVSGSYAYHWDIQKGISRLQMGLSAGFLQKQFDGSYYNPKNPGDPLIPTGKVSGRTFDMGLGVHYSNVNINNLNVGISATHITGGSVSYPVGTGTNTVNIVPNLYAVASMEFPLGGGGIVLQPNLWVKKVSSTQFDLNCMATFNQKFAAGLTYRDGGKIKVLDAFSLMFGYYIQQNFYVGYAYDIPITRGLTGTGTHEIFARYCFTVKTVPPPVRYKITPRFLGGYK